MFKTSCIFQKTQYNKLVITQKGGHIYGRSAFQRKPPHQFQAQAPQ